MSNLDSDLGQSVDGLLYVCIMCGIVSACILLSMNYLVYSHKPVEVQC